MRRERHAKVETLARKMGQVMDASGVPMGVALDAAAALVASIILCHPDPVRGDELLPQFSAAVAINLARARRAEARRLN